jgi:enoyl-CoA hydratase
MRPVEPVRTALRGGVLLIQLDGPERFPRLSRSVVAELQQQFTRINAEPAIQGVVLTGTERAFAAGAELAEVSTLTPLEALQFSRLGQNLMHTVERCRVPVIAAVRGWCLGGGFDLALACHVRIASEDAQFGHPGGSLGLVTGWGGTARLPRIVGHARALELLVTGRTLSAREALAWRLVSRITPPGQTLEKVLEFVARP